MNETEIDSIYTERAHLIVALAKLAHQLGYLVGRTTDDLAPSWPVLVIELPTGQVSWHFHPNDAHLLEGLPRTRIAWDGHTTPIKYARLAQLSLEPTPEVV